MHTRNQNKTPMIPGCKISRNPSNKSEVLDDIQLDKQQKIGGGKMAGSCSRSPLSAVNALPSEGFNGDSIGGKIEFKSRGDVEKLLAEKLNPKNRNNEKGRNIELRDIIKKFKTCINWYMELEDGYLSEMEKLRGMMESEQRRHSDIEAHMSGKIDELTLLNEDLQKHVVSLEESLRKEELTFLSPFYGWKIPLGPFKG